jgi:asparagine synthase (glutamine-hydrolysing)
MTSCYQHNSQDGIRYFSDLRYLLSNTSTASHLDLDIDFITHYLAFPKLSNEHTGLRGVMSLTPGVSYETRTGGTSTSVIWAPAEAINSGRSINEKIADLRTVVSKSVADQIEGARKVCITLSGGIDSSILAAVVAKHVPVVAINLRDRAGDSDERRFAEDTARAFGLELHSVFQDGHDLSLDAMSVACTGVMPSLHNFSVLYRDAMQDFARDHGADVIATGFGGDVVFMSDNMHLTAVDQARDQPFEFPKYLAGRGRTFGRTKRRTILWDCVKYGVLRRPYNPLRRLRFITDLLSDDAIAELDPAYILHPWVHGSRLPPGKRFQLLALSQSLQLHTSRALTGPIRTVHPYVSQSVVEHCMNLPTYSLYYGLYDRTLLRTAFADQMTERVRTRTSKGGSDATFMDFVDLNRDEIFDILSTGYLVGAGLLSPAKLQQAFERRPLERTLHLAVINALAVELWAQNTKAQLAC